MLEIAISFRNARSACERIASLHPRLCADTRFARLAILPNRAQARVPKPFVVRRNVAFE